MDSENRATPGKSFSVLFSLNRCCNWIIAQLILLCPTSSPLLPPSLKRHQAWNLSCFVSWLWKQMLIRMDEKHTVKIWNEELNKLRGKEKTKEIEAIIVNQHAWSLIWTYVWHPNKQQSIIGAQRGPIQDLWLIFFTSKTTALQERESWGERTRCEDGGVWEKCRADVGEREGGALCLFKVEKKYCTISRWHNNATAHIQ